MMDPQQLYAWRILIMLFIFWFLLTIKTLNASWIGLHPPELDMLSEHIVEEYREKTENQGLTEKEAKEAEEKRREEEELRKETYDLNDDVDYNYWQQWRFGGGFINWS